MDIRLINLSNYVRPKIVETASKEWVLNGVKNSFYQTIVDRYKGSPTNASLINTYVNLTYGRGLGYEGETEEGLKELKSIISDNDLRRIVTDYIIFGEASEQVIKNKGKGLSAIKHIAKNLVVPNVVNENNEIDFYWFSQDWSNEFKNPPNKFASFGTSKDAIEIFNIKPYSPFSKYFSDPEYLSGLPYAEAEEEIANLYVNSIKKGLSAGYIINIPDGVSYTAEEKDEFERKIKQKLTGSTNASDFIISFNNAEVSVTIEPFPVNENIHKQWESLNDTCAQKLLTAHQCTSPSIAGIVSSSGFSNTADEMDMAEEQLIKRVIRPKQNYILDSLNEILSFYGYDYQLFFKPLTEKKEEEDVADIIEENEVKEETQLKKKGDIEIFTDLGEDIDLEEYDLIDEIEVDYEDDIQLTATISGNPKKGSVQDSKDILIRYKYVGSKTPERQFCKDIMNANKVYRKEDIVALKDKPINKGWGLNGADTYSIWKYKGGGACKHKWNRVIFLRKGVKTSLTDIISTREAKRRGYKVPTNNSDVSITPNNMPNMGFVNK